MKKSEFVPGVLFHLPGSTIYVYIYRTLQADALSGYLPVHGIDEWGYLTKDGKLVENREKKWFHLDWTPKGVQLWQVTASVYLYSKTIPFGALTKVDLPVPTESEPVTQSQII